MLVQSMPQRRHVLGKRRRHIDVPMPGLEHGMVLLLLETLWRWVVIQQLQLRDDGNEPRMPLLGRLDSICMWRTHERCATFSGKLYCDYSCGLCFREFYKCVSQGAPTPVSCPQDLVFSAVNDACSFKAFQYKWITHCNRKNSRISYLGSKCYVRSSYWHEIDFLDFQ